MVLILAHAGDAGAAAVAAQLARTPGAPRVRLVRPEALTLARWSHRLPAHGAALTRIDGARGAPVADGEVGAVLDRIRRLPAAGFHRATAKDRDYAAAEWQALVASWLAALGDRVVHPVHRHPWVTPLLSTLHWSAAAASAGLPLAHCACREHARAAAATSGDCGCSTGNPPAVDDASGRVLVADEEADGTLAAVFGEVCIATARQLGFPLLEFRFIRQDGEFRLAAVDALPALQDPRDVVRVGRLLQRRCLRSLS